MQSQAGLSYAEAKPFLEVKPQRTKPFHLFVGGVMRAADYPTPAPPLRWEGSCGAGTEHLILREGHIETVGHQARSRHILFVELDGEFVIYLAVGTESCLWVGDIAEDEWTIVVTASRIPSR